MTSTPTYDELARRVKELEEENARLIENSPRGKKGLQLQAIVEAFDGFIYLSSADYRIEFMNDNFIRRTGYDATGEICYKALHQREDVCPWCLNPRVFKGETVRCEAPTPRNNWFYVVSTPVRYADGSVAKLAMIIDISGKKHAEYSLNRKIEEQELLLDN
ncbi:MAG: hypothetical protein GY859_15855, partial [Desulfobacterales bacterium]|nr:hypothetical protein [Desulfobacterales bacterium]